MFAEEDDRCSVTSSTTIFFGSRISVFLRKSPKMSRKVGVAGFCLLSKRAINTAKQTAQTGDGPRLCAIISVKEYLMRLALIVVIQSFGPKRHEKPDN